MENQSPFITEMGRFLGVGIRWVQRFSVAEGRYSWSGSGVAVVFPGVAFHLVSSSHLPLQLY